MTFAATTPALPVRRIDAAAAFYAERLGFTVLHQDSGFARVVRDEAEIHLWAASDSTWRDRVDVLERPVRSGAEDFIAGTTSCRIRVTSLGSVHAELAARDVLHPTDTGRPARTDWGTLEVNALDLDGNLLTLWEPVS